MAEGINHIAAFLLAVGIRAPWKPSDISDINEILVLRLRGASQEAIAEHLASYEPGWTRSKVRTRLKWIGHLYQELYGEGGNRP